LRARVRLGVRVKVRSYKFRLRARVRLGVRVKVRGGMTVGVTRQGRASQNEPKQSKRRQVN
jgi:hypothetical protein